MQFHTHRCPVTFAASLPSIAHSPLPPPHLRQIGVPVVYGGNATDRAGDMVQELLSDVDRHTKPGEVGAIGPPQVVERVRRDLKRLIKLPLRLWPAVERPVVRVS